jgi:hypothetical protein
VGLFFIYFFSFKKFKIIVIKIAMEIVKHGNGKARVILVQQVVIKSKLV